MNETDKLTIAVIGGGASGMLAAIFASREGAKVTIFEAKTTLGKKINATGNGKCNFTNLKMSPDFYCSGSKGFVNSAISEFDEKQVIAFFESIGIMPKERNGYVYPHSEQAASVSKALALSCESEGVKIIYEEVTSIKKSNNVFIVNGIKFDKVIIACGSFANMKNTDDFKGYTLCKSLGHTITPLYPALVQLQSNEKCLKTLNGVRQDGEICIVSDGKEIIKETGELLFSEKGVSGIPSMQVSRFVSEAVKNGKKIKANIDFFPSAGNSELSENLLNRSKMNRSAEDALTGLLNYKLNYVCLLTAGLDPVAPVKKVFTTENIKRLVHTLKCFSLNITGTNPFEMAQVVAGGVDTTEINPITMESKLVKGLYFAGEIIDVDGTCGGYNLQWAWSSGHAAGVNAGKN